MLSSRSNSSKTFNTSLQHSVIEFITSKLINIEQKILKKKDLSILGPQYKTALKAAASNLHKLSIHCFCNVYIETVNTYKKSETPENYAVYIKTWDNLSKLINHDVLSQAKLKHAVLHAERWIYIAKLCYERGDYFSAGAIIVGLTSACIESKNIEKKLSTITKGVFEYYQTIFQQQAKLYSIQLCQHQNDVKIIPLLTTLENTIANVAEVVEREGKINDLTKSEIEKAKKIELDKIRKPFKEMKVNLSRQSINHVVGEIFKDLQEDLKINIDKTSEEAKAKHKKTIENFEVLINSLFLYDHEDRFYYHVSNFPKVVKQFSACRDGVIKKLDKKNNAIFGDIETLLYKKDSYKDKLEKIQQLLDDNEEVVNSKLLKICKPVIIELKSIESYKSKRLTLEPNPVTKSKIVGDDFSPREKRYSSSRRKRASVTITTTTTPTNSPREKNNKPERAVSARLPLEKITANKPMESVRVNPRQLTRKLSRSFSVRPNPIAPNPVKLTEEQSGNSKPQENPKNSGGLKRKMSLVNLKDTLSFSNHNHVEKAEEISVEKTVFIGEIGHIPETESRSRLSSGESSEGKASIVTTSTTTTTTTTSALITMGLFATPSSLIESDSHLSLKSSTGKEKEVVNTETIESSSSSNGKSKKSFFIPLTTVSGSLTVAALVSKRNTDPDPEIQRSMSAPVKSSLRGVLPQFGGHVSQMVQRIEQRVAEERQDQLSRSTPNLLRYPSNTSPRYKR